MTLSDASTLCSDATNGTSRPKNLKAKKIGLVTRDYGEKFENGHRDFSELFSEVLKTLDEAGCDTVVFSPYSIDRRGQYDYLDAIKKAHLNCVKMILLEVFTDSPRAKMQRRDGCNSIVYRTANGWQEERFPQHFGNLTKAQKKEGEDKWTNMDRLLEDIPTKRTIGNCCILVCGETNGVKYSKANKLVEDTFDLRKKLPGKASIILNPVHDRMSRFEMPLKRKFLSEGGRYVISLWNKGKEFGPQRKTKDGENPPWMVCHNGEDVTGQVAKIENVSLSQLEIGIIQIPKA